MSIVDLDPAKMDNISYLRAFDVASLFFFTKKESSFRDVGQKTRRGDPTERTLIDKNKCSYRPSI